MARTLNTTVTSAIARASTRPVYLVQIAFSSGTVYAATWGANITWNGQTWIASGLEVTKLTDSAAAFDFPNGTSDPWLSLILNDGVRNVAVSIYEHHTDATASPTTDAVLLFTGILDAADIGDESIRVSALAASAAKKFPPTDIDQPTFTFLPAAGTVITWGNDKLTVQ